MNLIFVTDGLFRRAGTERVICQLSQQLAINYPITIVVPGTTDAAFPASDMRHSLGIAEFPSKGLLRKIGHRLSMGRRLYCYVKRRKDFVLLSFTFDISLIAIVVGWLLKRRVIVSEHIYFGYHQRGPRALLRRLLYSMKHVQLIVLTDSDKKEFSKIGINATVIPNFVSQPSASRNTLSKNKKSSRTLLMIGRHSDQKDFEFALRAFHLSRLYERGWRMVIIGNGELFDHNVLVCNTLGLHAYVEFAGEVADVESYYRSADLFCLTSKFEAFPMVLLEAISFGLPVLSVDCPTGPREILANEEQIVPRNITIFSEALVRKGDDNDWRQIASSYNRTRAVEFSPSAAVEKMVSVISTQHRS